MSNRIEAARRKPHQWPPGGSSHCACSRLYSPHVSFHQTWQEFCKVARLHRLTCERGTLMLFGAHYEMANRINFAALQLNGTGTKLQPKRF